jgi:hypothetical protein
MGKLTAFKSIRKEPLPPLPPKIVVPTDPGEAYRAGLKKGEEILAAQKAAKPVPAPLSPAPQTHSVTPVDPMKGTTLYKESDTGIGYKRWAIWLEHTSTWTVWTEWGHENKHQARKNMSFLSETRAKAYLQNCVSAKLKRGYRRTK